jgi:hypothetical protein
MILQVEQSPAAMRARNPFWVSFSLETRFSKIFWRVKKTTAKPARKSCSDRNTQTY